MAKKTKTVAAPEVIQREHGPIEWVPIDSLADWPNNPRTHSDQQLKQLAKLILRYGFTNVILTNEQNVILAGMGRRAAARLNNMSSVPRRILYGLTEEEQKNYVVADNQSAITAGWDEAALSGILKELNLADWDMGLTAFPEDELAKLLTYNTVLPAGLTPDDAVPGLPKETVSKPGDVWVCGSHRVMCGDSESATDLEKLMAKASADLLFTDPPYGVAFEQGKYSPTAGKNFRGAQHKIQNDEKKGAELTAWFAGVMRLLLVFTKGCAFYVWSAPLLEGAALALGISEGGWKIQSKIIWKKSSLVLGRCDYHWQHEECWYGFKADSKHAWYGGRDKTSVWDVQKMSKVELHPTQKPVELAAIALENSTKPGDIVLDPFAGSGMTLIAAQRLGRSAYCMDVSPSYADVMVRRWQNFTGLTAYLEADGRSFNQMAVDLFGPVEAAKMNESMSAEKKEALNSK